MRVEIAAALFATAMAVPALAAPSDECPPARFEDRKDAAKVSFSLSLLSKLVSSIGVSPEYERETKARLPQTDEYYGKLIMFSVACRQIVGDQSTTKPAKLDLLKQWYATIFLAQSSVPVPPSNLPPPALIQTSPRVHSPPRAAITPVVAAAIGNPPPRPPPANATTLRVFMKSNLQEPEVVALQSMLPQYDVRIGKSDIDPSNSADVVWANRNAVSPEAVLQVLSALKRQGIQIKSIQQSDLGGRKEVQVGTIVQSAHGAQIFADVQALNVDQLRGLQGAEFWKAGFNGAAWCQTSVGRGVECRISSDGRPVRD